jgi:hypothetical protein
MDLPEKGQKLKKLKISKIIITYVDGIQNALQKMTYIVIYGLLPYGNSKKISN